jgi:hypothetical protein
LGLKVASIVLPKAEAAAEVFAVVEEVLILPVLKRHWHW